jgi:nucleoside-diphosphate-sugar epimerase
MRILVTGADGFVGARVAHALLGAGHEVHGVVFPASRPGRPLPTAVRVHPLDLCDGARTAALCEELRPEACVHAAWYTEPGKYLVAEENLGLLSASVALAQALGRAGCKKFVGLGTCFEYDTGVGYLSETAPCAPQTLYGACKHALHTVLSTLAPSYGMGFAWARLFLLYGPGEAPQRLVPDVAQSLLRGQPARVSQGMQVVDMMHVDDVARALSLLASGPAEGAFNVASGVPVAVRDVVATLAALVGRPELPQYGARPSRATDPQLLCADVRKLGALGFVPAYDLRTGLQSALDYWRGQLPNEVSS